MVYPSIASYQDSLRRRETTLAREGEERASTTRGSLRMNLPRYVRRAATACARSADPPNLCCSV